jgi:hypothetical protein
MEMDGAKQCFKFITEKGLKVSSFISDRHLGVAKWICETHPDVQHYNDLDWHVNKSLKKKLFDASKEKGNEAIQLWMKAISHHLYWCARSTRQGFGEMIVAKWVSLIRQTNIKITLMSFILNVDMVRLSHEHGSKHSNLRVLKTGTLPNFPILLK